MEVTEVDICLALNEVIGTAGAQLSVVSAF